MLQMPSRFDFGSPKPSSSTLRPRALTKAWPALRVVLDEYFEEKTLNILRASTFPLKSGYQLHYYDCEQWLADQHAEKDEKELAISHLASEIWRHTEKIWDEERKAEIHERVRELLWRYGFGYTDGRLFPVELQVPQEITSLSDRSLCALRDAISRYATGDSDGAMTLICTAVDEACASAPGFDTSSSYQKRVINAYAHCPRSLKVLPEVASDIELCDAQKRSVGSAAYILQRFRQEYSDAHRTTDAPLVLIQCALDSAVFLLRVLAPRNST